LRSTVTPIKKSLVESCIGVLSQYRKFCSNSTTGPSQLVLPESLKLLPAYTLSLLKHAMWRQDISIDERAFLRLKIYDFSPATVAIMLYPRMVPIHELPPAPANVSSTLELVPPTSRLMIQVCSTQPNPNQPHSTKRDLINWL
jgi:protein transport protein SEC24